MAPFFPAVSNVCLHPAMQNCRAFPCLREGKTAQFKFHFVLFILLTLFQNEKQFVTER